MEALAIYLNQADAVSLGTAAILLIMSIISWSIMLIKWQSNRSQRRAEQQFCAAFWDHADPVQLATMQHGFGRLASAGYAALRPARLATDDLDGRVTRALRQALDVESAALDYGQTLLASVGSTAPFVGLFGTVWSIHHALLALGARGAASLDQVAGPVGEALVMTGAGLAVAIPAVIAHNLFTRTNRLRLLALDGFAYDLHAFLVAGAAAQVSKPEVAQSDVVQSSATEAH